MVSVDSPLTNAEFAKSLGLDFPILSDPGREVARAYGVIAPGASHASRVTFYIDPNGVIRGIDRKVDPATSGRDMAARLRELGFAPASDD